MTDVKNVYQRLLEVQKEAHAPRDIDGKFGKARSAEQILEAYKPVCNAHGLYLFTSDIAEEVAGRSRITVTATVVNTDSPEEQVHASASAWENEVEVNKYGSAILDTSQVSGKTGSYAKKYALQNLFAIDDTKDADSVDNLQTIPAKTVAIPSAKKPVTEAQRQEIKKLLRKQGLETKDAISEYLWDNFGALPESELDADEVINALNAKEESE